MPTSENREAANRLKWVAPSATTARSGTPAPSVAKPPETTSPLDTTAPPAATLSLIASGAKVGLVASGLTFAEGPVWLSDGRLIVSDVNANAVVTIDAAGNKSDLRRPSNVSNGHALAPDGSLVEAEMGDKTNNGLITRVAADGSVTVLADNFEGKRFNSPNDLTMKSDGTIWFTDPDFGQEFFPSEIGFNGVYRLDPQTKVVTLLTKTLDESNRIAFSHDEKTLYVTDCNSLVAFPVLADGTIGPSQRLGAGCDGRRDEQGKVWASRCNNHDVVITSAAGRQTGAITFPGTTTNLAWGTRTPRLPGQTHPSRLNPSRVRETTQHPWLAAGMRRGVSRRPGAWPSQSAAVP